MKKLYLFAVFLAIGLTALKWPLAAEEVVTIFDAASQEEKEVSPLNLSENEWKQRLSKKQFEILRKKGTEKPFADNYHDSKKDGLYKCAACGTDLYHSKDKFDSGTGWPSFVRPVSDRNLVKKDDYKLFYKRTELLCKRCGGHLGHVFKDGPQPTGERHCINGAALVFEEKIK